MADASQYQMNPQVGKMMSGQRPDAGVKKPDPGLQEEKDNRHPDHVELHGHEPGPFKTMHHHGDGEPPEERTAQFPARSPSRHERSRRERRVLRGREL